MVQCCDNVAANRYWLLECKDIFIAFPPNGAVVALPDTKTRDAALEFKAQGGRAPLTWLVNGALVGSFDRFAPAFYKPGGEGVARVTVVDAEGRSDSSTVRFKRMR